MTDVIDQAQAFDALNLAQGLEAQRVKALHTPKLEPAGYCHNPKCLDDFEPGSPKLFCGPACAQEHHNLTNR